MKTKFINFKCHYPSSPVYKPLEDGGFMDIGVIGCRSEWFIKLTEIGNMTNKGFIKIPSVYQCAMCGVLYQIPDFKNVKILIRDKWCSIDLAKSCIYTPEGEETKVIMTPEGNYFTADDKRIQERKLRTDVSVAQRRDKLGKNTKFNLG